MADNTTINLGVGGDLIASDDIAGVKHQRVKVEFGADGFATDVSAATPLPVAGTFFQATQPVSGAFFQATQPVSGVFFQTTQPISGTVSVSNMVAQGLTDTQLRATPISVSMSNTLALTDTQIRATPLPVSGTVAVSNMVAQGITDTQIRATALPVSGAFFQAVQPTSVIDVTATGTLAAAAQTVVLSMAGGLSGASVQITGTWVGTIAFEGTVNGTDWSPVNGVYSGANSPMPTTTANGLIRLTPAGLASVRVNMTAFTSGSATIFMRASDGVGGIFANQILPIKSLENGMVSTANSSAVVLGIGGVYTGTAEDVTEYADIRVFVFADQASATDGLQIQQSSNGTNWDISDLYSIPAATGKVFSVGVSARFLRIVYTNGATAQTAFRLQVKLHKSHSRPSSVRPQDARGNDNDMDEILAHGMVYNGTGWDRMRGSIANGLAVDVTRLPALVASAAVIGATNVNTAIASATTTLHNANVTTGLTLGTNLAVTGYGTAVLKVTGTFVASFAFKISTDAGVSWDPISATQIGGGDIFTTATQPGSYRLTVAGLDLLRVEVTLTSGSITVTGKSSNAVNASKIVKLATSGLTIGNVLMTGVTSVTTLSVANTAATLTLPAAAAGQFHYVTRIRITLHNTSAAAVVGSAVTLAFTSTNLPGALAWTDGNALAAGTSKTVVDEVMQNAVKASAAATATTITAPIAGAGIQSRITAYYYTGV